MPYNPLSTKVIMKNIGFACKLVGVPNTTTRTCLLGKASPQALEEVSKHNIEALGNMVDYCQHAGIKLFRISSDMIPLASHPTVSFDWQKLFTTELAKVGEKIKASGLRVSMHPGQYTVLNSSSEEVVEKAVQDLQYHADFLDLLGVDISHKMILHIGGVYGEKEEAVGRFVKNFRALPQNIQNRLVLENDDKSYSIGDVYKICQTLEAPAVFDVFHHSIVPSNEHSTLEWLALCHKTWQSKDGVQKIHYSEQLADGKAGMHSQTISSQTFYAFYQSLSSEPLDIMLEVKDKNLSAIKCINCVAKNLPTKALHQAWAQYKYAVLAKSQKHYLEIRQLFASEKATALEFYKLCEEALALPENMGNAVNAAEHAWGYFKTCASESEKKSFAKLVQDVQLGKKKAEVLPRKLLVLAEKYQQQYLLDSLYLYGV